MTALWPQPNAESLEGSPHRELQCIVGVGFRDSLPQDQGALLNSESCPGHMPVCYR